MCEICKGKLYVIVDGKIKPCGCIYLESGENWANEIHKIVAEHHRKHRIASEKA